MKQMKSVRSIQDLYIDQLRDLHSMTSQVALSLPKLGATAANEELRTLILMHGDETDRQRAIVMEIFARRGEDLGSDRCKAVAGLIEGGDKHLANATVPPIRDLMMIAHCLRIEHYEIAAYEITARLAERLGLDAEAQILSELLSEQDRMAVGLLELESRIFVAAGDDGEANLGDSDPKQ